MNITPLFNDSTNVSTTDASPRGIGLIIVESFIFLVLNITALVGNLLICAAFYRNPSLRTVTNIFILSLALTDILTAVFVMPLVTASSFANRWLGGETTLNMNGYCAITMAGISLLTVMLLAINRYFRVVRPELYHNIYSKKSSTFMAVTAWILTTLVINVGYRLVGFHFRISRFNPTSPVAVFPNRNASIYYNIIRGISIIFPSLVVIICYSKIYQTIRQHNSTTAPPSQEGHSPYGVEEAKMTRLLTVVVVCFYFCWISVFVYSVLQSTKVVGETSKYRNFHYLFPSFASNAINPIVYGVMNQAFRAEFLKIIHRNGIQ